MSDAFRLAPILNNKSPAWNSEDSPSYIQDSLFGPYDLPQATIDPHAPSTSSATTISASFPVNDENNLFYEDHFNSFFLPKKHSFGPSNRSYLPKNSLSVDWPPYCQAPVEAYHSIAEWGQVDYSISPAITGMTAGPFTAPADYLHPNNTSSLGGSYQFRASTNGPAPWDPPTYSAGAISPSAEAHPLPASPRSSADHTARLTLSIASAPTALPSNTGLWGYSILPEPAFQPDHTVTAPATPYNAHGTFLDPTLLDFPITSEYRLRAVSDGSVCYMPKAPIPMSIGRALEEPAPSTSPPSLPARLSNEEIGRRCKCPGGPSDRPSRHWAYSCPSNRNPLKRLCEYCNKMKPARGDNFKRHQGTCKEKNSPSE